MPSTVSENSENDSELPYHAERRNLRFNPRNPKAKLALVNLAVALGLTYASTRDWLLSLVFGMLLIALTESFHLNKIRKVKNHSTFIQNTTGFLLCTLGITYMLSDLFSNNPEKLVTATLSFTIYTILRHYALNYWQRTKGKGKMFLYVGAETEANLLVQESSELHQEQYHLIKVIPNTSTLLEKVVSTARSNRCYNVVISSTETKIDIAETIHDLLGFGFNVEIYSPGLCIPEYRATVKNINGRSLTYIEDPHGMYSSSATRVLDLTISMILLPVLAVITSISVVLLKWKSPGSVFYVQTRIGKNAETFKMVKYRTMHENAPKPTNQMEGNSTLFKHQSDPRITKFGSIYRKLSIDELPQIINVIKGEMSLVGPRPAIVKEMQKWDKRFHKRISVKPGMTGLWQVSGRSDLSFEETKNLDIHYVEHKSFRLDLKILLKTIPVVLGRKGAY